MKAKTFAVAMLVTAPAAAAERLDCIGQMSDGALLNIYLEVGAHSVWSRIGDAQASGSDPITSRTKTSIKFGGSTLTRSGHTLTLIDPRFGGFGAFECSPYLNPFAR